MEQQEADRLLEHFWGWSGSGGQEDFHAPLPPTEAFPTMRRAPGIDMPPYLLARGMQGCVEIMLCAGDGRRASYDPEWQDPSQFVYVGGENVPGEWKHAIAMAVNVVGRHWPGIVLMLRPKPDEEPRGE